MDGNTRGWSGRFCFSRVLSFLRETKVGQTITIVPLEEGGEDRDEEGGEDRDEEGGEDRDEEGGGGRARRVKKEAKAP